jgi:hypothetical protein
MQMVYLTIVLALCSTLSLGFNSAVLRIAKKQLNAIYAHHEPSFRGGRRKLSVICTNCGYKNETFVNTHILPVPQGSGVTNTNNGTDTIEVLGPLDLHLELEQGESSEKISRVVQITNLNYEL